MQCHDPPFPREKQSHRNPTIDHRQGESERRRQRPEENKHAPKESKNFQKEKKKAPSSNPLKPFLIFFPLAISPFIGFRSSSIMQLAQNRKHSLSSFWVFHIHTSWPVLTLVRVVQ
jgi:hypothetical protein